MRNQLSFFATKADLESLLLALESKRPLKFVLAGLFDSTNEVELETLRNLPTLGSTATGNPNHEPQYLVAGRDTLIVNETVPQRRGGVKYAVSQSANPQTIAFQPGGAFGAGVLISGYFGTVSDDSESLELFRFFKNEVKKHFSRVKSDYVGKEASELLDRGWRLTSDAKSPALYDLKRE